MLRCFIEHSGATYDVAAVCGPSIISCHGSAPSLFQFIQSIVVRNMKGSTPYNRNLHKKHTWASLGRCVTSRPDLCPHQSSIRDKLDFNLDAVYCHSLELFPLSSDIVRQKETFRIKPWRCLQELRKNSPDTCTSKLEPMIQDVRKERIDKMQVYIPPAHSEKTNAGYSRNIDGTFFKY
ncbi:unnamed protein product [Bemisia tabaci]|uniref:Uncharacterized protein n=1 Tax=Bemisia tabaci TaxID=7038 RepID=A0A9P0G0S7_BEMTA|nr:unnamed protein product [Bemisia tabaci]